MATFSEQKTGFPLSEVLGKGAFLVKNPFKNNKHKADKELRATLIEGLELLRDERGVFTAALSDDYNACWMRDQLYANLCYYYLGDKKKFREGLRIVFEMCYQSKDKIDSTVAYKPSHTHDFVHAKFCAQTLKEITNDWGHHQIDAIGLFLYMIGFAHERNIPVIESEKEREMVQLLVQYLTAVRYWEEPDNGMWEEWTEPHASSIGAAVAGLQKVKEQKLAVVADSLIAHGLASLHALLPKETPVRDQDLAQLSLIWPYRVVATGGRDRPDHRRSDRGQRNSAKLSFAASCDQGRDRSGPRRTQEGRDRALPQVPDGQRRTPERR